MSKVKVTGNENGKIVFRAYLRHKWIDLCQTKIKMITDQLYTYRRILSPAKILSFVIFVGSYLVGPHVAAVTWPCTWLFAWCPARIQ